MSTMSRRAFPLCVAAAVVAVAFPAFAAGPTVGDGPARALQPAVPASPVATDIVGVYDSGALDQSTADAALLAARDAGGKAVISKAVSLRMRRLTRGADVVQEAPSGFAYPMGTTVLPRDFVSRTMGRPVSAVLGRDTIVMGALTAGLRGARAGDRIDLVASSGSVVTMTIGAVVDDEITGGTELLMSPEAADRLGINRLSQVLIWGFRSRQAIDGALAGRGLVRTSVRIRRTWDPPDPDSGLGMARTKAALGEFAYRLNSNGSVSIESGWYSDNITFGRIGESPYRLNLSTGCHRTVRVALEAAMAEVIATGNADSINYFHANTAGGCYVPRFSRLATNSSIGFLSRHTWGMAIDTNTIGSCMGCAPPDFVTHPHGCATVRIFRKHGFAWGGNYLTPDGMHFEWVGEPRDQLDYPSRFCPNIPSEASGARPAAAATGDDTARATLFALDGIELGD